MISLGVRIVSNRILVIANIMLQGLPTKLDSHATGEEIPYF
jgi:hypothetical protein